MKSSVERLLSGFKIVAVVCNQWGDTGKGKIIDFLSCWADIIARGTGGANAGHTIVHNGSKYVFHLIPSGIMHDSEGKINVIGSGVAFDPMVFCEEMESLAKLGITIQNLKISHNAKLVLPQHILLDRLAERSISGIGTTGRGIGPAYADYVSRTGLRVNDLLNPDIFKRKFLRNLDGKMAYLKTHDREFIRQIMQNPGLQRGRFCHPERIFDVDAVIEYYLECGKLLSRFVCDTDAFIREMHGKKNILLEGAQGLLLSLDYGSYPYVTSSDSSVHGLARGVGLERVHIDCVFGVAKAFYMTRVGRGPFPTEIGGKHSEEWCNTQGVNEELEQRRFHTAHMNCYDEMEQSVGIRITGAEYGATTRRPRRVGWFDIPLLRYAAGINGKDVILTKLDVLSECDEIKICTDYMYNGPDIRIGDCFLKKGDILPVAIPDAEVLEYSSPIYRVFPGWKSQLRGCHDFPSLPKELRDIIKYIEENARVRIPLLSVGKERDDMIFCEP